MAVQIIHVMDTETTGKNTDPDAALLEVAVVELMMVGGRWSMRDSWHSLVRHAGPIPPQARAVHHISPEMVADAPTLPEIQREMATFGAVREPSDIVAHAAHHASFDRHFLPWIGGAWIDTWQCALHLWPEAPAHGNQVLRYYLDLDPPVSSSMASDSLPHRALYDTICTASLLLRMLEERTAEELVRLSGEPALLHRMSFGKHEGVLWSECPPSYLRWVRDTLTDDPNKVHTASYWLRNQGGAR